MPANAGIQRHRAQELRESSLGGSGIWVRAKPWIPAFAGMTLWDRASAMRLAGELDCPVTDCFCLALAVREGCPVVTADQRFHAAVAGNPCLGKFIKALL